MNSLTLKTNSWHHRLVWGMFSVSPSENFCTYFWQVVGCSILFLVVAFVLFAALVLFGLVPLVTYGWGLLHVFSLVSAGPTTYFNANLATAFDIFVGAMIYLGIRKEKKWEALMEARRRGIELPTKEPSFLGLAWHTFKDKVCWKVDFK